MQPHLSSEVSFNGGRILERPVSAADIKAFLARPEHLRNNFEDEVAHFVWGADLGLVECPKRRHRCTC